MGWRDTIKPIERKENTPQAGGASTPTTKQSSWRDSIKEKDSYDMQESSDVISSADRFYIKNLGNDDKETQLNYLRSKYPDAEFSLKDDAIAARKKGESKYRAMDPEFEFTSPIKTAKALTDTFNDITDVAYDTLSGAASGASALAGGTAGLFGGGPVGLYAGASLAGGGSSAALEALRQKLGAELGINKEVKAGDVAMSGVMGAAAPLLFGTTKTAIPILKDAKIMGKNINTKELGGLSGYIKKESLPKLAAWSKGMSGFVDDYRPNAEIVDKMLANPQEMIDYVGANRDKLSRAAFKGASDVGRQIDDAAAKISEVDVGRARKILLDAIDNSPNANDLTKDQNNIVKSLMNKFYTDQNDYVSGSTANKLRKQMSGYIDSGVIDSTDYAMGKPQLKESFGALKQAMNDASGGDMSILNSLYRKEANLRDTILPKVKNDQSFVAAILGLNKKSNRMFQNQLENANIKEAINIPEVAAVLNSYDRMASGYLSGDAKATAQDMTKAAMRDMGFGELSTRGAGWATKQIDKLVSDERLLRMARDGAFSSKHMSPMVQKAIKYQEQALPIQSVYNLIKNND